ncbi:hypothetical protein [Bacillus smithii]|uniref:hypothetical protein n=1 Tax=Bacillus smithii TaxID=1479 RepID=UPI003D25CE3F
MGIKHVSYLEWEGLQDKYEITNINTPQTLKFGKITLFRDEEYNIKGFINGEGNSKDLFEELHGNGEPGQRIKPFEIKGTSNHGLELYTLRHCYLGDITNKATLLGNDNYKEEYKVGLSSFFVEKKYNNGNNLRSLTEWYLNGPNQNFLFNRTSERVYTEESKLIRTDINVDKIINGESISLNRDYLLVELDDYKFIIHSVPKQIGPDWSNNIGIEYSVEFGKIPDENEREGISEIVSFLFGRHLLKVGYTEYDENNYPIRQVGQDPWGNNVVSKCKSMGFYPIKIDDYKYWGKAEELLKELVPIYIKYRNELNLKDALWSFWISEDVPVGTNIPIIANALEILKNGWFKSNKSKTKGVYMPKKQFDELLDESFMEIEEKLKGHKFADRILRRIKGSFNMGVNESLDFFFEEIGLKVGEVEKKAIKSRNSVIHGTHSTSDEDLEKIIFYSKVYKTLFHRAFLKLLLYKGEYIDYSITGWPNKNIDEVTNYK